MKKIIYTALLIIVSVTANAQIETIISDRPGQTASPFTTPKKWIQSEAGFSQQTNRYFLPYKDLLFQHPWLLTKYGLARCFELRLITAFATIKQESVTSTLIRHGINSIQLGGKLHFFDQKGLRPATALIAHYDFLRFQTLYKGDTIDAANFRFAMQHRISEVFVIGYNIGMEWRRFGSEPYFIYTFSPGFNISERWYAFAELYGFIQTRWPAKTYIDGGVAFNVNDNFKIDASASFGLNKKSLRTFSIGASFRFKTSNKE